MSNVLHRGTEILQGCALVALLATPVVGQVVAPSVYTTSIMVQGEDPGTEFDDWANSGITIASSDPLDNPGFIDIADIQVANDDEFLYLHVSYHDDNSMGTFLGFDFDQDPFTGFDIFSLGFLGAELGYTNDFPFEQDTGVFNTGDPLTGGPIGNGGALLFPFWNENGPDKEWAVPLDVAFTNPDEPAFASPTFNFMVYSDQGLGDISEVITYTLAEAPAGPDGDFDGSGTWDCADVDALVAEIVAGTNDSNFDMNADGTVDLNDITDTTSGWLVVGGANNPDATGGAAFLSGDANLDGSVDVSDFNTWNSNKFTANPAWCAGDFNADGIEDVSDFNIWNSNKFQSSGDTAPVPEPAAPMGLLTLFLLSRLRRQR